MLCNLIGKHRLLQDDPGKLNTERDRIKTLFERYKQIIAEKKEIFESGFWETWNIKRPDINKSVIETAYFEDLFFDIFEADPNPEK